MVPPPTQLKPPGQLKQDALRIWQAGVEAVRPERLLAREVEVTGSLLRIGQWERELATIGRIAVVGAGKAGAATAQALETQLGPDLLARKQVSGWVNVPADTLLPTQAIHLHAGRPAGVNEPRPAGVEGTRQILQIVRDLGPDDLCICLISGGGSALLPAPVAGISLAEKIAVTRLLSGAGASIEQLNTVRRQLSEIKGGGLARACRAGMLLTLIISDVLGDPLEAIASGPTVPCDEQPADALRVLQELGLTEHPDAAAVVAYLTRQAAREQPTPPPRPACELHYEVLANNAVAVDAAGIQAERLGYRHAMISATASEGPAEQVGQHLAQMALQMRDHPGPNCLISGGEPTVQLVSSDKRGLGGRNQQLVLAAMERLGDCDDIALLSGGTDGEDGPTDAAGAWVDQQVVAAARRQGLNPAEYLARNDAYHFFQPLQGLLQTGPTSTNVCDLRVIVVQQRYVQQRHEPATL